MDQESAAFWTEVEDVFTKAVDLPRAARAGFLAQVCEGRPAFRGELEGLLASHDQAGDFLTAPPLAGSPAPAGSAVGLTIGPYRLVERIGAGGMGSVYRAERIDGFSQTVAIKLIDVRLDDPETVRRFTSERQILATLNHPHIVRLLDGRIEEGRQPYLVMEYVDGIPITRYCELHRLTLEERLRLLCDVCEAVHEAHEHGIVHRDLKPANILVTPDGAAKVLDYGIAKLLTSVAQGAEATRPGVLQPLTPNYASPEQFRGLPVTTAADVYALGVLLYEVVTGHRPYETADKPVDAMLRIVLEQEPARPSAAPLAALVPYPARRLKGDLDAIVFKAMSKEPSGRYASSRELASDILRHLHGRPVIAREPAFAYVAARLARRHRAAFIAAGVVVIALLATLGVSLWHVRIAERERNRATTRFNDVRHLANALIFKIHDQVSPLPGSTAVRREIVSEALAYLEKLAGDPSGDDALRLELAKGYHRIGTIQGSPSFANLGDREGALRSYRLAAGLLQRAAGDEPSARPALMELARVQLSIAAAANIAGQRDVALSAAREAVNQAERLVRLSGDDDGRRLLGSAYFQLAGVSADNALPHWQRAGAIFDALLSERPDDADRQRNVALAEKYTGAYYERSGNYSAALQHHLRARGLDEKRLAAAGADRTAQFDLAIDLGNIAYAQSQTGRLREAAAGYEASLKLREALSNSDPEDILARGRVAFAHNRLSDMYMKLGEAGRAVAHASRAVTIGATMMAVDPLHGESYVKALQSLGVSQRAAGRQTAACIAFGQAVTVMSELEKRSVGAQPGGDSLRKGIEGEAASCAAR